MGFKIFVFAIPELKYMGSNTKSIIKYVFIIF